METREREKDSPAGWALRAEPEARLYPRTLTSQPEWKPRVGTFTDCTTQAPPPQYSFRTLCFTPKGSLVTIVVNLCFFPQPLTTTSLLNCLYRIAFSGHVISLESYNTQSFSSGFFLSIIIFLIFIHVMTWDDSCFFFPFLWPSSIPLYAWIILFIHAPADGHLDNFQFGDLTNNATMNIHIQVPV